MAKGVCGKIWGDELSRRPGGRSLRDTTNLKNGERRGVEPD